MTKSKKESTAETIRRAREKFNATPPVFKCKAVGCEATVAVASALVDGHCPLCAASPKRRVMLEFRARIQRAEQAAADAESGFGTFS